MKMARIILFTGQIEAMSRFYAEVLGLRQVTDEKGWKDCFTWPQRSEDRLPRG
jgi:catechol 2,3-dioxygenase-like lactoylglutathione lyase family enzyme